MNLLETLSESLDRKLPDDFFKHYHPTDNMIDSKIGNRVVGMVDRRVIRKKNEIGNAFSKAPLIRDYTESSFNLNGDLWNGKLNNKFNRPETITRTNEMNDLLKDKHLKTNTHVYTGVYNDLTIPEDGIVHIPSFLSTSLNPKIAESFGDSKHIGDAIRTRLLRINLQKGTSAAYIGNISHSSNENEVLLPSNQLLKIEPATQHPYKVRNHNFVAHVHDARLMTDEEIEENKDHPEVKSYLRTKELLK